VDATFTNISATKSILESRTTTTDIDDRGSDANRLLNESRDDGEDVGGGEGDTANIARTGDGNNEDVDMIMMMDSARSPVTTGDESPTPPPLKVDSTTPPPTTIPIPVITTSATSNQAS